MSIFKLLAILFAFPSFLAASVTGLALPTGVSANAVQHDSSGNLFIAGSIPPKQPKSPSLSTDIYVAKLSPDGATVLWSAEIGGSGSEAAAGLAISPSGAIYVTGSTSSPDFPVTASAVQSSFQSPGQRAFLAQFDAQGKLQNATFLGGVVSTSGYAVVLTSSGQPVVTGFTAAGFAVSPNTPAFTSNFFLIELDAAMAHVVFASSVGGQFVALDPEGNIYVAGTSRDGLSGPMTPGAFQTSVSVRACNGTLFVAMACNYQYVAKLDPTGAKLLYATFVAGAYGATPSSLIVDSQGNAIVAGSTSANDYPVTPGSFEPVYLATAPSKNLQPLITPHPAIVPPPQTGYLTKLNPQGTGLVFSTFLGGTATDTVTGLTPAADGSFYVSGFAQSTDFPGVEGDPAACFPQFFLTRITADGSAIAHTAVFSPNILCPQCSVFAGNAFMGGSALLVPGPQNFPMLLVGGQVIATADLNAPAPAIGCVLDAADMQPVSSVAPGQLLSLFGRQLASGTGFTVAPKGGEYPTAINGVSATFNGTLAPQLYYASQQDNVQVPYEVAGSQFAQLQIAGSTQKITLPVVAANPSVFLRTPPAFTCLSGDTVTGVNQSPLAFNADGSLNTCENPAAPGSSVTIYLNGLGAASPSLITGEVTRAVEPLNVSITSDPKVSVSIPSIVVASVPGSINAVWQAQVQLPNTTGLYLTVALSMAGVPFREQSAVIWTKASSR